VSDATPVVVRCTGVIKDYRSLRPLRLADLTVAAGERVVLGGLDVIAAEVLTNLLNGYALPDQGEIAVFGRPTSAITSGEEWLASLDPFGVVTARAVLLEGMTIRQNLALPLTIEIDPVAEATLPQVDGLAHEAGIEPEWLDQPAHAAPALVRMRLHLARAVALSPQLLILEHPTASLEAHDRPTFAGDVARVVAGRALTMIAVSQDREFARRTESRFLQLHPGTGQLR
jgi:putative ABC transport system ATP-binding protein